MIELKNISKTFFKGKSNEVHAIQQTSITFPNKGLVVLCGPSGSGKTTLLNVLGGLEYIDSGEIQFGHEVVGKRNYNKLDSIRNEKIGYIFQQYHLLPYLTVYENIELVLKMLGIQERKELDRRIQYVLELVGMLQYRHRKVSALSGGQQQRVGIARAIAKNPEIIIADEPTGNLDSRNTVEIMNIIKKISEQKLVILVTHERELAEFYGERIIEISDGRVIRDMVNEHSNSLAIRHHNTIYLKDLKQQTIADSPVHIDLYTESAETPAQGVKVTLISRNDAIYIQVDADEMVKVRYVDQDSEVSIYDEHYKGVDREDIKQVNFDLAKLASTEQIKRTKGSAIPVKTAVGGAYRKIRGLSKLQKVMYLSFVFAAMLIALAISLIGKMNYIVPDEFQTVDKQYVVTDASVQDLQKPSAGVLSINPLVEPQRFGVRVDTFYQINQELAIEAHPSSLVLLKETNVTLGRYPTQLREVVLDARVAKRFLTESEFKQAGFTQLADFVGLELMNESLGYPIPLTIVGISDRDSPTVWMNQTLIDEIAMNRMQADSKDKVQAAASVVAFGTWETMGEQVHLTEGRLPEQVGEVVYPEQYRTKQGYSIGASIANPQADQPYTIVGFYKTKGIRDRQQEVLLTMAKQMPAEWERIRNDLPVLAYAPDLELTEKYLTSQQADVSSTYEKSMKEYKSDMRSGYYTLLSFAFILLGVSLLQLYFIIRSSLLNRIYDIGVYRSLGASRWDIHKMFVIEIALLTTVTSLIGYLLMTLLIKELERLLPPTFKVFYFPMPYIIGGIILIYAINIASGLYPVYRLTRKSPSQILKHSDA